MTSNESQPKNKVLFEFHRNILFDKRMFIQLIGVWFKNNGYWIQLEKGLHQFNFKLNFIMEKQKSFFHSDNP